MLTPSSGEKTHVRDLGQTRAGIHREYLERKHIVADQNRRTQRWGILNLVPVICLVRLSHAIADRDRTTVSRKTGYLVTRIEGPICTHIEIHFQIHQLTIERSHGRIRLIINLGSTTVDAHTQQREKTHVRDLHQTRAESTANI